MSKMLHRHVACLKTSLPLARKKSNCVENAAQMDQHTTIVMVDNNTVDTLDLDGCDLEKTIKTPVQSSHLLEYYRTFFNLGYFLLIIPFRLVKENRIGEPRFGQFTVRSHSRQKVLCAIVQVLIAYEYLSSVRLIPYDKIDGTPIGYLNVATVIASVLYVIFFIYVFWAKAPQYREMFLDLQNLEFAVARNKNTSRNIRILSIGFCLFAGCVALTDPMIHDGFLIRETNKNILKKYACKARSYYLFKHCPDVPVSQIPPNESFLDHFVLGIHMFILIPNLIMVHIVDVAVVLTAICLWQVLGHFIEHSKETTCSADQALTHYEVLKRLVVNTNSAVGLLTFSAVAISLPFYASWGAIVFNDNSVDWLYLIHILTYFVNFFLILAYGADFNFKVGEFYGRISAPGVSEGLPSHQLISLLMDQHANQISIRGCGFFVMTYRFFGTILSLIATYSIIILQFQFSRRSMSNVNCTYLQVLNSTLSVGGTTLVNNNFSMKYDL